VEENKDLEIRELEVVAKNVKDDKEDQEIFENFCEEKRYEGEEFS
jgi:hypothetical protein